MQSILLAGAAEKPGSQSALGTQQFECAGYFAGRSDWRSETVVRTTAATLDRLRMQGGPESKLLTLGQKPHPRRPFQQGG